MRTLLAGIFRIWNRLERLKGNYPIETDLSQYWEEVDKIDAASKHLRSKSDGDLKLRMDKVRRDARKSTALNPLLQEAFSLVQEASFRVLGMRHFQVQLLAGIGLHRGKLIEMHTGEGKTLAAVLPACLNALAGGGVHILTFNDYLARRDAAWMAPLYNFLGFTVGAIQEGMTPAHRREAYAKDITYTTANEAGFDFLRMHLAREPNEKVHRPFNYAIIDEADSLLIDEARVPLVIAGERATSDTDPYRIATLVASFEDGKDWETDENNRNVLLTDQGIDKVEAAFDCGDLHADANYLLLTEVNQALHARVLLKKGVDYIVRDNQIEIVDEFTGRVVDDRRWPDGLQEALEAKEKLAIQPGGRILGSIALQHFLKQYPKIAGMTATATSSAEELFDFYDLKVLQVPRNKASIRKDLPTLIFPNREAKYEALATEIAKHHKGNRPVLVGTCSVNESEQLAAQLEQAGIVCKVLNAKNDEVEAAIISEAGVPGAVTISTNMAGRGTDIKLGGKDEAERNKVVAAGGLFVMGTNLHESNRIDNQLRGRAGRQGDPGSSQFFVSLEDNLMKQFGINELIPERFMPASDTANIDNPVINREVARIQRIVDGQNYEIRKTMWRYSQMIESQRKKLMKWRDNVFMGTANLDVFESKLPDRFNEICRLFGKDIALKVEREVTLHFIDACWSDHLSTITQIREGIHLVGIGGLDPLSEFHKQIADAFWELMDQIELRTVALLKKVAINKDGLNKDEAGIRGPSSTWTYLINDRAYNDLQQMLFGHGSAAFGAGIIMTWPLLLAWGIWKRMKMRKR